MAGAGGAALAQGQAASSSDYVEGAWNGPWKISYPNGNRGTITFTQVSDSEGRSLAAQNYGKSSLASAGVCPSDDANTEFYTGQLSYQSSSGSPLGTARTIACTSRRDLIGRYRNDVSGNYGGPFKITRDGSSHATWSGVNQGGDTGLAEQPWNGVFDGPARSPEPLTTKDEVAPPPSSSAPPPSSPPPSSPPPSPPSDPGAPPSGGGATVTAAQPEPSGGTIVPPLGFSPKLATGIVTVGDLDGSVVVGEGSETKERPSKNEVFRKLIECWLLNDGAVFQAQLDVKEINTAKFLARKDAAKRVFEFCFRATVLAYAHAAGAASSAPSSPPPGRAAAAGCQARRVVFSVIRKKKAKRLTMKIVKPKQPRTAARYTCMPSEPGRLNFKVDGRKPGGLKRQLGPKLELGLIRPKGAAPAGGPASFTFRAP